MSVVGRIDTCTSAADERLHGMRLELFELAVGERRFDLRRDAEPAPIRA